MIVPVSLQDVRSLTQKMLASPSDQVRLAAALRDLVQQLPPERSQLLSRVQFDRAGLWSLVANFFDVPDEDEPPPQIIRIPHDVWIRGVQVFALPALDADRWEADGLLLIAQQRAELIRYGTNWRGLVEVNWRLNNSQGFISSGMGELLAPAAQVSGDGQHSAALDWRLQRDDTISVRVRNRIRRIFPTDCATALERTLPWICVAFWAEEVERA
jgi:hypothetical protein